jgi:hypothetical protein
MSYRLASTRRSLPAVAALLLALTAIVVFTPTAKAAPLNLAGGYTTLTTDPGTTSALVSNRILPLPVLPSWVVPTAVDGKLALNYRFYITGGQIDSKTLAGQVYHSGGLKFMNLSNGKSLTVRSFTIDTTTAQLTADVPALGVRAPILNLDLSGVTVGTSGIYTKVGPVPARLTDVAAGVLNDKLGSTLFSGGLLIGTANVYARFK